jgi:spore coat polysaccharide biosynthesis predicted glycosyltransferase SpsG
MDKNFNGSTKIKNSNIYKVLGSVPNVVNDPVKLSKYLQNIRPIFEKANMEEALKLIDKRIKSNE